MGVKFNQCVYAIGDCVAICLTICCFIQVFGGACRDESTRHGSSVLFLHGGLWDAAMTLGSDACCYRTLTI